MNHPNIAKVFDAGTTESGRPYFVMELVRGIPITEFCDVQKLNLRERMELFVTVCEAVHHAHQKGIIHRDLKPSNLLVELHDVKAVPKVIDFGIAKSTNQKLTERTLFTNFSQMIGTPMYMSPEQSRLSGLDIDIRTDIYSLGVLLYELLTGTTPLTKETLSQIGYDELRRRIQEEEPPRASARISTLKAEVLSTLANNQRAEAHRLSQHIRGELDWIVAKALDKDRTRRYQSALEFADDINRFLNGEPVEAHPPSVVYRLTKIARRHRTALAMAAVLLLVLLSATGISLRYAMVADRASRKAEDQRIIAAKEKKEAETQRNEAQRLQAEAVQQGETIRKNHYVADMRLAALDLKSENIARLHTELQAHVPNSGGADYRRWEWYYLQASSRMNEKTFHGHTNQVEDVAWSPDGKFIGSAGHDGAIIWNATTGKIVKRFLDGSTIKRAAAWSPDSTQFAWGSAAEESAIRIWNSATDEKHILRGHTFSLQYLAWSPDGRWLASSAMDSTCRIWDVATKECIKTLNYETGHVNGVAWHPEGKYIATAGSELRFWNPVDGSQIQKPLQMEGCQSLAFTADGAHLIAVDNKGQCHVMDTDTWKVANKFNAQIGSCQSVAVFGNAKFAISGSDGAVTIWSFPECVKLTTLDGHEASVNSVSWDPTGNYLASGSSDKLVKIWSLSQRPSFQQIVLAPTAAVELTQLTDSSRVGVIIQSEDSKVLDLKSLTIEDDRIKRSVFDLRTVAQDADAEALVRLANLELRQQQSDISEELMQTFVATVQSNGQRVIWSPDRTRVALLVYGLGRFNIRVWSTETQKQISEWGWADPKGKSEVKWAPDSRRLGLAGAAMDTAPVLSDTGWVYIFDTDTGKTIHGLGHGLQSPTSLEWEPTGLRIASAGAAGDVVCWDALTGKQLASGKINRSKITCLAWSPDQSRIAVARANGLVNIIDPESCENLLDLDDAKSSLKQLMWSKDGQRLIGIDSGGSVLVWDASRAFEYVLRDEFNVERLFREANECIQQTKYADALTFLDELLNRDPDNLTALRLRAWECNRRLNLDQDKLEYKQAIIADYQHIVEINPDDLAAWINLGWYLNSTGRSSESVAIYTKGLEREARLCSAIHKSALVGGRALSYIALSHFSDAKRDLVAAPDNWALALLHLYLGEQSAYAALCESFMNEATLNATNSMGKVHLCSLGPNALQNYEKAILLAQESYKSRGRTVNQSYPLGAILFRAGQYQTALEQLTKMEEGDDAYEYNCFFLAMCHQELGNNEAALSALVRAKAVADKLLSEPVFSDWATRTSIELLRAEATKLIHGGK